MSLFLKIKISRKDNLKKTYKIRREHLVLSLQSLSVVLQITLFSNVSIKQIYTLFLHI